MPCFSSTIARVRSTALLFCLCLLYAGKADAVSLAAVFGDGMVLQREKPVPVWGKGEVGEVVQVSFNGQLKSTTCLEDGTWRVALSPMEAGGPFILVAQGKNTVKVSDVLVGDVWLCSGQSNMAFAMANSQDWAQEQTVASIPQLRLMSVPTQTSEVPVRDAKLQWQPCTPESARLFSAVAYYFGKRLHQDLNVPIGLINASFGSTYIEGWTNRKVLERLDAGKPVLERWDKTLADYPAAEAAYKTKLAAWEPAVETAKATGQPTPAKPVPPVGPGHRSAPGGLYNAMIYPLLPYAVRGIAWYQGEFNVTRGYQYREILPVMIADWRASFEQPELPFYIVQLPGYGKELPELGRSYWAELRESQAKTAALPNNGLAVTIDLGETADIHPRNKRDFGERLAKLALAKAYGRQVEYSGPVFESATFQGRQAVIRFTHSRGLATSDAAPPIGFLVAGADRKWVPAQARMDGETIVVSAEGVLKPVAVRYAWANSPQVNVINYSGLPAAPFRTDDWPLSTMSRK